MPRPHTPDQFKSRHARLGMALVGLLLAFGLATRAIQTGSVLQYAGTLLLLVLAARLSYKAFRG